MTKNTLPTGEVTEAMIEAGVNELGEWQPLDGASWKGIVEAVYLAMRKAATPEPTYRMSTDEHNAMHKALMDSVTVRSTIPRATPEQDGLVEMCERLRALVIMDEVGSDNPLGRDAANHIEAQAVQIAELRRERDEAQRRDERVREAMFVLSDRLNLIGALDSDNVHAAYEKVVAALTNNGGEA